MHHPWRAFRHLADWTLHWAHLPEGILGHTDHARKIVTLAHGLTQAERRCTIEHERQHVLRGPVAPWRREREEREVDAAAARQLISLDALVEALAWSDCEHEVADELWVDVAMLRARLEHLHPSERHHLRRRLEHLCERA